LRGEITAAIGWNATVGVFLGEPTPTKEWEPGAQADYRWKMDYARDSASYYDEIGRKLDAQLAAAGGAATE
jgi:hypothetical protein